MTKSFWLNKKVIVTGGAGFIASHIVDLLLDKGAIVTVIISPRHKVNDIRKKLDLFNKNVLIKKVDLMVFENCMKITKNQNILLNFAAMDGGLTFKKKYPGQIFRVNTQIVMNLLEACVINKIQRLLLTSSVEVYPQNTKNPIKEEYGLKENFNEDAHGYTWSKRFGEIAAKMYYKEFGLKIAIARLGNIYGPRDDSSPLKGRVIPVFIKKVLSGDKLVLMDGGGQKRSFLFVKDVAYSLLQLVENYVVCDPVNIVGEEVVTIKELANLITLLIENKVVDRNKLFLTRSKIYSSNKAKKIINFSQKTSLIYGLLETIAYYREANIKSKH